MKNRANETALFGQDYMISMIVLLNRHKQKESYEQTR